jgi:single-strand DNA-binding protein
MVNSAHFIGRLGQNPEIRTLQSGDKLATWSMALSESWKDKDGNKQEKTTWINCNCFGKQAEIIEKYVKKGDLLYVEAKVQVDQYEKDSVKMTATKFNVKNFTMLSPKSDSNSGPVQQGHSGGEMYGANRVPERSSSPLDEDDSSDLPF